MIGVAVITHENLGEALVRCVTHVLGTRPPKFDYFPVGSHSTRGSW